MKKWIAIALIVIMWGSFFFGSEAVNAVVTLCVTLYLIGGLRNG